MKKLSKLMAALLALMMCLSLLPVQALAYTRPSRCSHPSDKRMSDVCWAGNGSCTSTHRHTYYCRECLTAQSYYTSHGHSMRTTGVEPCTGYECSHCSYGTPITHKGTLTTEYDENQHWQHCDACNQDVGRANHIWNYTRDEGNVLHGTCSKCEATYEGDHACVASEEWLSDGTSHWHQCTVEGCRFPVMDKEMHNNETVVVEATCTENGSKTDTCTVCGNTKVEVLRALGHEYDYDNGYAWDDSQRAFVVTCLHGCGETEVVYASDLDQDIAKGLENGDFASANYRIDVITPNTCISEGKGVLVLTTVDTDGEVYTESVPLTLPINPDAHDPAEPVVENLDEETGAYDTVVYCTRCNAEISRTQVGGGTEIDEPDVPLAAGPVTRGEFVDYLWRHEDTPDAADTTFADVAADHEYFKAIGWAQSIGVARGSSSKFAPDDLVTVAQVRLFLARFAEWKGVDMPTLSTLTGADNEAVLNCDEVLAEFFGEEYVTAEDEAA